MNKEATDERRYLQFIYPAKNFCTDIWRSPTNAYIKADDYFTEEWSKWPINIWECPQVGVFKESITTSSSVWLQFNKKLKMPILEIVEQKGPSHAVGGNVNLYNTSENYLTLPTKIHILLFSSFIPRCTYANMWAPKEM